MIGKKLCYCFDYEHQSQVQVWINILIYEVFLKGWHVARVSHLEPDVKWSEFYEYMYGYKRS